jgi:hypothetical protein
MESQNPRSSGGVCLEIYVLSVLAPRHRASPPYDESKQRNEIRLNLEIGPKHSNLIFYFFPVEAY